MKAKIYSKMTFIFVITRGVEQIIIHKK